MLKIHVTNWINASQNYANCLVSFFRQCSVLLNNNSTIFTMIKGQSHGKNHKRYMFGIPFLHKVYGSNVLCTESTAIWQNFFTVTLRWFQNSHHYRSVWVWFGKHSKQIRLSQDVLANLQNLTIFCFKHLLQRPLLAALGQWPSVFLPSETESEREEKSPISIFASSSLKYICEWDKWLSASFSKMWALTILTSIKNQSRYRHHLRDLHPTE